MGSNASGKPEPERNRNEVRDEKGRAPDRAFSPGTRQASVEGPDVHLNVPELKVDEISLEVENLEAHVSLVAQVLDMLRLNVGADVYLGKVKLEIKGVEAEALLNVRLDNVAAIVDRVLTTLDRNPEILQHVGRGLESLTRDVGSGAGSAVGELGRGTRSAVQDVGRGAGGAVQDVGRGAGGAVQDVGRGAGGAVQDVGKGAGGAVENVGEGAGGAVQDVGKGASGAVQDVGKGAGEATQNVGEGAGQAAGEAVEGASDTVKKTEPAPEKGEEEDQDQGRETEDKTKDESGREPEPETAQEKDDGGEKEGADGQEITALQNALHETEESVRDLGRTLRRLVSHRGEG